MAIPWPAIIAGGASILGGMASARGLKEQNKQAREAAAKQMRFQERMSSTAHQREVKDLRAAGLNPILSATGGSGASSPGGASAPVVDERTAAVATASQLARTLAEIANIKERTRLTGLQADVIKPAAEIGSSLGEAISSGKDVISQATGGIDFSNLGASVTESSRQRRLKSSAKYKTISQDHSRQAASGDYTRATITPFFSERLQQGHPTKADLTKLENLIRGGKLNDADYWAKYLKRFRSK